MNEALILKQYSFKHSVVNDLKELILNNYHDLFNYVIVHGSVATNEVINYSDFDGLIIVKDKFKNSVLLNEFVKRSEKIIYKFDPLQHHGWFILFENDLNNYPEEYFPIELLKHSALLFPDTECEFRYSLKKESNYKQSFFNLTASLQKKLDSGFEPINIFQLKSFLSEIMLLPAVFIQAKSGTGVFKKYSFELAKKELNGQCWGPIEMASEIRFNWNYTLNPIQHYLMTRQNELFRKLTKKIIAPKLKEKKLKANFYKELGELIQLMKKQV